MMISPSQKRYLITVMENKTGKTFNLFCFAPSQQIATEAVEQSYPKSTYTIIDSELSKSVVSIIVEPICPN